MQVPSDSQSSVPIEALTGSRAFAQEMAACQAIANSNEFDGGDFAFCGARMPLELVTHKDMNGILGVEIRTHSTEMRFTMPVKPIFQDIDVAAEVASLKTVMDAFVADPQSKCMHALSPAVDGLYIGFSNRINEPVKATFQQQPKASKTRVLSTTNDLIDDDEGFFRPMGHTNASAVHSYEVIYSNVLVKDCEKESKQVLNFAQDFYKALAKLRVPPKHVTAVAALMNVVIDLEKAKLKIDPKFKIDKPDDKSKIENEIKSKPDAEVKSKIENEVKIDEGRRSPKRARTDLGVDATQAVKVSFGEEDDDEEWTAIKPKRGVGRPRKNVEVDV